MNQTKIFIEYYSSTSLFTYILVSILSLHMFPRKDALLKLKVNAILAQNFRKELTLDLLNEFIYGITKHKITLVSWMCM